MNLEYICEQMVRILHGNITCISESGAIEACYGDMAAQCNPLFTDPEFLSAVHERERKDYPDLFYEKDTILYAVVSLENVKIISFSFISNFFVDSKLFNETKEFSFFILIRPYILWKQRKIISGIPAAKLINII